MDVRPRFEWIAGHLALDFTNTVTWRRVGVDRERIQSYGDLLRWSAEAGTLADDTIVALQNAARQRSLAARAAFHDAIRARAELHAVFVAEVTRQIEPSSVIALNKRMRRAMTHFGVRSVKNHLTAAWDDVIRFDRPLWPVLKAALDLIGSPAMGRLRLCANPECGWLFLDDSRKGNRRWCSMRECGSRAKARAYYRRQRGTAIEKPGA